MLTDEYIVHFDHLFPLLRVHHKDISSPCVGDENVIRFISRVDFVTPEKFSIVS